MEKNINNFTKEEAEMFVGKCYKDSEVEDILSKFTKLGEDEEGLYLVEVVVTDYPDKEDASIDVMSWGSIVVDDKEEIPEQEFDEKFNKVMDKIKKNTWADE